MRKHTFPVGLSLNFHCIILLVINAILVSEWERKFSLQTKENFVHLVRYNRARTSRSYYFFISLETYYFFKFYFNHLYSIIFPVVYFPSYRKLTEKMVCDIKRTFCVKNLSIFAKQTCQISKVIARVYFLHSRYIHQKCDITHFIIFSHDVTSHYKLGKIQL